MTDDSGVDEARVVWQSQPAAALRVPTQGMRTRAGQIDALLRRAKFAVIVGGAVAAPALGWVLWSVRTPIERIGVGLTITGVAFLIYQVWSHVSSTRAATDAMRTKPSVVAYRAALERHRQFYGGVWTWSRLLTLLPGPLLLLFGAAQADGWDLETILTGAVFITLSLGASVNSWAQAARYQTEIDEVDRLQAEGA